MVARRQLLAAGLSVARIDGLVHGGWLRPVHRGVYSLSARPPDGRGWAMAALLTQRRPSVLSHRSAAALWGLRPWPSLTELTMATRSGGARREGLRVHRAHLPDQEVTTREALAVTTPSRTLLDLASVVDAGALERAAGEAERLRIFDLASLHAVLATCPGRRGSAALRALLGGKWLGFEATRSELERRFLELCRRHRLELPAVNRLVEGYAVDFLWPRQRLVAETDGAQTHLTRSAFEEDRVRDALLAAAGYRVVRFTYRRVCEEPDAVAAVLRRLI